ncbi:hypothetical protein V8E54_007552 [Elaphomyces granulatus]
MANVASSYRKQGRRTEAEKLEMQAMDTRKAHGQPGMYLYQGRWTEAEKLYVQVVDARQYTGLSILHPEVIWVDMPRLYLCFKLVSNSYTKRLGPSHPQTVAATADLKEW